MTRIKLFVIHIFDPLICVVHPISFKCSSVRRDKSAPEPQMSSVCMNVRLLVIAMRMLCCGNRDPSQKTCHFVINKDKPRVFKFSLDDFILKNRAGDEAADKHKPSSHHTLHLRTNSSAILFQNSI